MAGRLYQVDLMATSRNKHYRYCIGHFCAR